MLEGEIKRVIEGSPLKPREHNINVESVQMFDSDSEVRTFVLATKRFDVNNPEPKLFRSYHCKGYQADHCMIWEAARATTAAPTFFKEIVITHPPPGGPYIDGGIGHNNPSEIALEEAVRIWPEDKHFALISLGTGKQGRVEFPKPIQRRFWSQIPGVKIQHGLTTTVKILEKLSKVSTDSEKVHEAPQKIEGNIRSWI